MLESKKKLICLCNDDQYCPQNIERPNEPRHCVTQSVCFTKRFRNQDGSDYFKYFCDDAFSNSIRENVIEYRDCLVNTTNKADLAFVTTNSAEFCCDSEDFCNEFLIPQTSVLSPVGISDPKAINIDSSNIFTTINILFLSLLSTFALCVISILVLLIIKKRKKNVKTKTKTQNHLSSLSSASSTASSSKSKATTATTVQTQLTEKDSKHILLSPKNLQSTDFYHTKIDSLDLENNHQSQLKVPITLTNKRNDYLNDKKFSTNYNEIITANDLFEPLIDQKCKIESETNAMAPKIYNDFKENSFPLTLGSDFCTTSDCYTTSTTSGGLDSTLSSSQNPNIYSTQYSNTNGFEWSGSGSGAGVPQLLQRTIARQIKLIYPCIGKGRFGEVYKGMWRDEYIAVKTFNSADEKSWENECNIYNTSGFRHENILGFIASDNIDRGTYTELWIITEYHHNGSLYDYLNLATLKQNPIDTLKMMLSIVNGLDHLHTAIESCTGKPALAHCDLKSKNILVKADLTCCISDLGLALCGDKNGNVTQNPATIRTGTKRYMAPEILAKTINYKSLLQFQNAEMYSLALIFWELLRRTSFELEQDSLQENNFKSAEWKSQQKLSTNDCNTDPIEKSSQKMVFNFDYKLPYYEYVQSDPDEFQMKQLVCDRKVRPEINQLWKQVPILSDLTSLTEELWVDNPNGRLNALRLKKSLNQIKRKQP